MAIDPITPSSEAHDLAQAQKGFYPCNIRVSHWQLRHYISAPDEDHLYYASGHDVFCLDTATKKRKHIATIPFEARCTASGYGWVCVGGEDEEHRGYFASIKLDGSRTMDVDAPLPFDGWRPNNVGRRAPTVKVERVGEEIVNSISIHRIRDEEAHMDDIVAVLTNNDKTVRVYSLPAGHETRVKDLPFAINHATISPDGQMMVAVGDFNQAYFFTRELTDTPPQIPKPHNRLTSASVEWRFSSVVTLHATRDGPVGYFTTAWSPSGVLVAVGSEGGFITIIDTEMLANPDYEDDEAVVAVVPGSRADLPSPHPGAIRSMLFSPEPWDLLIWAEDHGRVCIGDLRTGLRSKQVINLEPHNADSWERLSFEDLPSERPAQHLDDLESEILRRYREGVPDHAAAVSFASEYREARRLQQQRRQDVAVTGSQTSMPGSARHTPDPSGPPGLTEHEQQILDSLRTSRQREEARSNGQVPRSVNYTSADMFPGSGARSSRSTSSAAHSPRPYSDVMSAIPDSFPELSRTQAASPRPSSSHVPDTSNPLPPLHALQDGIWGSSARPHAPYRSADNFSRLPRRRQSVVMSPPGSISPGPGPSASAGNGIGRGPFAEADDEDPWGTIAEHMTAARGPLFEGAARASGGSYLPAVERFRRSRLAREIPSLTNGEAPRLEILERYEALSSLTRRVQRYERTSGERTAGLALSPDGSRLWAACEKGIFEIGILTKGRMFMPALQPR